MSVIATNQPGTTARKPGQKLWVTTVGAGLVAAVATTTVAAVADAAGVSLDIAGEPIPVLAFAQMTFLFSLVGLAIAAGLRRWAGDARTVWLRTTIALTALSFVPDLLADAATATKLTLMLTHVVAAAIVIPVVARRLR
ncbi:hypothetical protein ABIE44_002612 [Marmoricola sp. OAE513]|uniref:DUF6069 family protein n=1 Tax=Marmoricola sp. OAE513 TaxID=2817894 RepID=UPI001AE24854